MSFGTGFGSTQTGFSFGPGAVGQQNGGFGGGAPKFGMQASQGGFGAFPTAGFGGGGSTAAGGGLFGGIGASASAGSTSGLFSGHLGSPSTNLFGKQPGTPTAFGSQSATLPFGSTAPSTGLFGQSPFSSQSTFGGSSFAPAQRQKGTGGVHFAPKVSPETDSNGKKTTCTYQHLSFSEPYHGVQQEVLRYEDYQQRNTGSSGPTQGAQSTLSLGGVSSQPSLFAGAAAAASHSGTGHGLFGAAPTTSSPTGRFGGTAGGNTSQSGPGWNHGSAQPLTTSNLFPGFGPKQPAQATQSFGFGAPKSTAPFGTFSTSLSTGQFGGTSSFGVSSATAPSLFGVSTGSTSTSLFGLSNATSSSASSLTAFPAFSTMPTSSGAPAPVNAGFNFSAPSVPSQPPLFLTAPAQSQPLVSVGVASQAPSSLQPTSGQTTTGVCWMHGSGSAPGLTPASSQAVMNLFGAPCQTPAQPQGQGIFSQSTPGTQASPHQMPYGQNPLPQLPEPVGWTASRAGSTPAGSQVIVVNAAPWQRYPARQLPLSIPPASSRHASLRQSSRSRARLPSSMDSLFSDRFWCGVGGSPRGIDEPLFKREDVKENLGSWEIKACLERTGSSPALQAPGGNGVWPPGTDGAYNECEKEKSEPTRAPSPGGENSLSEEEISRLLPTFGRSDYYTRPDQRGLRNMLHADRHAMKQVHGLVVGRRGYGELKFLEPVDVEGLNVCDAVSITRGTVSLYETSRERDVPATGQGLNQPAEVKLLDIFKTDKKGEVLHDQASKIAFKGSLKKYCKRVGAVFVSYDTEDGTWIFRVDNLV